MAMIKQLTQTYFRCFKTLPIFAKTMYIIVATISIIVKTIINIVFAYLISNIVGGNSYNLRQ